MNPYKIYKITFPNDKVYIGQTRRSVKQRLYEHHKGRRKSVLQKALLKYGIENIKVNVIKSNLSLDEANELEVKLIKKYFKTSYNVSIQGHHNEKYQDKHWRSKISSSQKGIPRWSDKDRERIRKQKTGMKYSEESKKLRSIANSRKWVVITPKNKQIEVFNLYNFCKERNLCSGNMTRVAQGKLKQHKGYKVSYKY